MRLLADENMPLLAEFFGDFGELRALPGRHMSPADVQAADVLLVRSVTPVSRELVAGSSLRWVGTATIGTDHIDKAALSEQGIALASAPGCNARAVGEYVVTALAMLAHEQAWLPQQRTLGIIGLGNTGSAVARLAAAMGFRLLGCDPAVELPGVPARTLPELLAEADILTLHVPLLKDGPHATRNLLGEAELSALRSGSILFNCSRGSVVDNAALDRLLATRPGQLTAILDVWEGEPRISASLLEKVHTGTPHVAGYSQEGKWRGTAMLYQRLCEFLGQPATVSLESVQPAGLPAPLTVDAALSAPAVLASVLLQACPLRRDDAALRASMNAADPAAAFDALRKNYPPRREFTAHRLVLPADHSAWPVLSALGFRPG
ncbi:MAG: 4-phosphoerythronate dehydrogenase [Pedobacter sp.]|nr:4-phosphoerythronate dehydrogenase [Pedobacter sp.]